MNFKIIIFGVIVAVMLSSCDSATNALDNTQAPVVGQQDVASQSVTSTSPNIALIDGVPVSLDLLRHYLAQKGYGGRNKPINKERMASVLDEIISLELYKHAALQLGLDKDPSIELSIAKLLANKYQKEVFATNADMRSVSQDDINAEYQARRDSYSTPERRRGALISVRLPSNADNKKRNQAMKTLESARESALNLTNNQKFFGSIAASHSEDYSSKSRHGDIGWLVEGATVRRYEPIVMDTLFSIDKVGDISEIVKGERGYYLLRLADIVPTSLVPLKNVKRKIEQSLIDEKQREAAQKLSKKLMDQFKVSVNHSVVEEFMTKLNSDKSDSGSRPPSFPVSVGVNN